MNGKGIVVEFPNGRRLQKRPPDRDGSIARLVRCLSGRHAMTNGASAIIRPLPIRLDSLTGLDDETVAGLAALAAGGVIAPASAARLAMRHAVESIRVRSDRPGVPPDTVRHPTLAMTLAGDVFGDFAFNLRLGKAWLGFAAATCLAPLLEICPPDRGAVCLLIGCDTSRRNTVRVLTPRDWRRCLVMSNHARTKRHHHFLVLGGIPAAGKARSSILLGLRNAVLASGNSDLVGAGGRKQDARLRRHAPTAIGYELLTLIELAMPGLVEADGGRGGVR